MTSHFRAEDVREILNELGVLLGTIAQALSGPVCNIAWPVNRQKEGHAFASTTAPPLLHHLFEQTVTAHPDAIAVMSDLDGSTSYRELDRSAITICRELRSRDIGPEDIVAIRLHRSRELAAVLGALKSGAAYFPLDPAEESERQRWMIRDSNAAAIVDGKCQN